MSNQEEKKNEGSGQEAKPKRQFYINIMGAIREFPGGRFYNPKVDGDLEGAEIVNPCTGKVEYIWKKLTPERIAELEAEREDIANAKNAAEPRYWSKVKYHAERLGIEIDANKARASRLEVALGLHEKGDMKTAIAIMQGEDFGSSDWDKNVWAPWIDSMGFAADYLAGNTTPEKFYRGFANIDRT